MYGNFRETYQTLHPLFSLKKENQDKLFTAFKLLDFALKNSGNLVDNKTDRGLSPKHT